MLDLLASFRRRLTEWLLNRQGSSAGSGLGAVNAVRLSVLRVLLLCCLMLGGLLCLHVFVNSLLMQRWLAAGVSVAIPGLLLLAAWRASLGLRRSAVLLVIAIYVGSLTVLVCTGWSPMLPGLGYVFAYAAPLVAGLLLSWRLALGLMLVNTVGLVLELNGVRWPQVPETLVRLPEAPLYVNAGLFIFFNVALPLGVFRLSAGMRAAQQQLQQSLRLSEDVFQAASAPTLVCDAQDVILRANGPFLRLLGGIGEHSLIGQGVAGVVRQGDRQPRESMPPGWRVPSPRRWLLGDGEEPCAVVLRASRQTEGGHWVYSFEDVTRLLRVQSDLAESMRRERWASRVDPVTGLPNRARCCRLLDHLQRRDSRARRRGLLTIRLNNLRQLNARFGVDGGDHVLRVFVEALQKQRPVGSVACRVRASVLSLLLPPLADEQAMLEQVLVLRQALPTQTWLDGQLVLLDLSFGLVGIGPVGEGMAGSTAFVEGAEWLRRSELALDLANDPRWRTRFDGVGMFNAQTASQVNRAMAIEAALPHALREKQLHLVYQPKFNPEHRLLGFEALARWRCEHLGEVSPIDFIPAAETAGLITQISDWALDAACAQLARWRSLGAGELSVAVNLSAYDLERVDLCERVVATVRRYGISPSELQLEVTESALAQREDAALEQLRQLRAAGFAIAVDDFGTGYSSLAKIVDMPLDVIKIDRSFLRDCPGDPRRERVVRSIVMLAHALKLEVVAEGVESAVQLAFLSALGVQGLQGYLLGRPEGAAYWDALVRERADEAPAAV